MSGKRRESPYIIKGRKAIIYQTDSTGIHGPIEAHNLEFFVHRYLPRNMNPLVLTMSLKTAFALGTRTAVDGHGSTLVVATRPERLSRHTETLGSANKSHAQQNRVLTGLLKSTILDDRTIIRRANIGNTEGADIIDADNGNLTAVNIMLKPPASLMSHFIDRNLRDLLSGTRTLSGWKFSNIRKTMVLVIRKNGDIYIFIGGKLIGYSTRSIYQYNRQYILTGSKLASFIKKAYDRELEITVQSTLPHHEVASYGNNTLPALPENMMSVNVATKGDYTYETYSIGSGDIIVRKLNREGQTVGFVMKSGRRDNPVIVAVDHETRRMILNLPLDYGQELPARQLKDEMEENGN